MVEVSIQLFCVYSIAANSESVAAHRVRRLCSIIFIRYASRQLEDKVESFLGTISGNFAARLDPLQLFG